MKKIKYLFIIVIGLMMALSLNSCEVYSHATTQDDIYYETQSDMVRSDVDFNVVIRYGTPYYYEGELLYYLYNGLYYYPFYYDNYWYVRVYRRPFNYLGYRPYFRPHRHDYRFEPGHHHGFDRPRPHGNRFGQGGHQPRPHYDARPGNGNRPQPGVRPGNGNHNPRPDARPTRPSNRDGFGNGSRPSTPSRSITPRPSAPSRSITPRSSSPAPRMSSPSSGGSRSSSGSSGRFGGRR